jgi:hypothetical protein
MAIWTIWAWARLGRYAVSCFQPDTESLRLLGFATGMEIAPSLATRSSGCPMIASLVSPNSDMETVGACLHTLLSRQGVSSFSKAFALDRFCLA